jgi:hypothetical protein
VEREEEEKGEKSDVVTHREMEDKRASNNGGEVKITRDDSHLTAAPLMHPSIRPQTRERSFSVDTRPPAEVDVRRRSHTMGFPPLSTASSTSSPDIRQREEQLEEADKARERRRSQQLFGRAKSKPSPGLLGAMVGSSSSGGSKKKRISSLLFSIYGMDTDKSGDQSGNETEPEPEEDELSPWGEGLEVAKEANGTEYCKAGSLGKIVEYLLKRTNGTKNPSSTNDTHDS